MQVRRPIGAIFVRQIRQSANIFVKIRKVNLNATVYTSYFAQIVKKVTSLTSELNGLFRKRIK